MTSAVNFRPSLLAYLLFPVLGLIMGGISGAWLFVLLGIALFVNVILHEFGHYWMAIVAGEKRPRITVGATGGSTSYSGMFMSNRQLACVIAAGPLMNILIGIFAVIFWGLSSMLAQVSFCLAIFNLLPIAQLDGGQLLRLFLGRYFDYPEKITTIISIVTVMALVAYFYFNFAAPMALIGIYLAGYLLVNKGIK